MRFEIFQDGKHVEQFHGTESELTDRMNELREELEIGLDDPQLAAFAPDDGDRPKMKRYLKEHGGLSRLAARFI